MRRLTIAKLPVSIFKENGTYVAWCPVLDISTCGSTLKEAQENFTEMVQIFIGETEKRGTLEEILKESGFVKVKQNHTPHWRTPHIVQRKIPCKIPIKA